MTVLKLKERWVCFTCRKMFRVLRQVENAESGAVPDSPQKICSACGARMYNIGSFFAPPPRSSVRRWEAAYLVAAAGYHCQSVGASQLFWELVGPDRPRLQDVKERMDGPYFYEVTRENNKHVLRCYHDALSGKETEWEGEIDLDLLLKQVLIAASAILRECQNRRWKTRDTEVLLDRFTYIDGVINPKLVVRAFRVLSFMKRVSVSLALNARTLV